MQDVTGSDIGDMCWWKDSLETTVALMMVISLFLLVTLAKSICKIFDKRNK